MSAYTPREIKEALTQPGCPVCRLSQGAVKSYLTHLFYESVNDIDIRARLRKSQGFCYRHAWQAVEMDPPDTLGVAIIYNDVIKNLVRALDQGPGSNDRPESMLSRLRGSPDSFHSLAGSLAPRDPCPACKEEDRAVQMAVSGFVKALDDPETRAALEASAGFCLPHLRSIFEACGAGEKSSYLLGLERSRLSALQSELEEFIRKNDYRFRSEGFGAERDSWRRAVAKVVGENSG